MQSYTYHAFWLYEDTHTLFTSGGITYRFCIDDFKWICYLHLLVAAILWAKILSDDITKQLLSTCDSNRVHFEAVLGVCCWVRWKFVMRLSEDLRNIKIEADILPHTKDFTLYIFFFFHIFIYINIDISSPYIDLFVQFCLESGDWSMIVQ